MPNFLLDQPMILESGQVLDSVQVQYSITGTPLSDGSNVVVVCHTLTGGIDVTSQKEWWFIGPGQLIDTNYYCVISMATLGSWNGSSSPCLRNQYSKKSLGINFPTVTVIDSVRAHQQVLGHLGIRRAKAIIGGSFGGFCVYTWLALEPQLFDLAIIFQSALQCSAHTIGAFAFIRELVCSDPAWNHGKYKPNEIHSMSSMQKILSFNRLFKLSHCFFEELFPLELRRQEVKLDANFSEPCSVVDTFISSPPKSLAGIDPNSLLCILRSSALFDLQRSLPDLWTRWQDLRSQLVQIPCAQDWRYPIEGMLSVHKKACAIGVNSQLRVTRSGYGHGSFLHDPDSLRSVYHFLEQSLERSSDMT